MENSTRDNQTCVFYLFGGGVFGVMVQRLNFILGGSIFFRQGKNNPL